MSAKEGALAYLDETRASLRLQLQTLRATVADYRFYRGDPDPTARYAAGLELMSRAFTVGSAPRDGWATFGSNLFSGLIDRNINQHGMPELQDRMRPGLAAIDKLNQFKRGVEATLGGDSQPTERQVAVLHDGLAELEAAQRDLAALRAHATVMERALTGDETFDDFMKHATLTTFTNLPGAQAWQNFETLLDRADDAITNAIDDARQRLDKLEPPKPMPIGDYNPFGADVPPDNIVRQPDNPPDGLPPDANKPVDRPPPSNNPFDPGYVPPITNPFEPGWVPPRSNNPFDT